MEKEKNLTNRYHTPSLIVMLTHEDQTVQNAYEIFDAYKDSMQNTGDLRKSRSPFPR